MYMYESGRLDHKMCTVFVLSIMFHGVSGNMCLLLCFGVLKKRHLEGHI